MGLFRPLVEKFQSGDGVKPAIEPSDRIITPATVISLTRPELARRARQKLLRGERHAARMAIASFSTDMEGIMARLVDKLYPESGLGASKLGAVIDYTCDTAALLQICDGALRGPRVSFPAKVGVGEVLLQELYKSGWAGLRGLQYKKATGRRLDIPVTLDAKEAMLEKMVGVGLAVVTNEIEEPKTKLLVGSASLYFSTSGSLRGEFARQHYDSIYPTLLQEGILEKNG